MRQKNSENERIDFSGQYMAGLCSVLQKTPVESLSRALKMMEEAYQEGQQVFLAGNGGSAATASHMANDLMKGVAQTGKKGFRAIALTDNVALLTAIANDESYEAIFSSQLRELAMPEDLLIVISGSGNSPNIVHVVKSAKKMGVKTLGFLGMGGGKTAKLADLSVIVPSNDYGPIESVHMVFDHLITDYFKQWVRKIK